MRRYVRPRTVRVSNVDRSPEPSVAIPDDESPPTKSTSPVLYSDTDLSPRSSAPSSMPIVVVRTRAVVAPVVTAASATTLVEPDEPPPHAPSPNASTTTPTAPTHALPGTRATVDADPTAPTMPTAGGAGCRPKAFRGAQRAHNPT